MILRPELTWTGTCFERDIEILYESGVIFDVRKCSKDDSQENVMILDKQALLPGFVNCHSHAFQRGLRGLGETYEVHSKDSFWTWRQVGFHGIYLDVILMPRFRKCTSWSIRLKIRIAFIKQLSIASRK